MMRGNKSFKEAERLAELQGKGVPVKKPWLLQTVNLIGQPQSERHSVAINLRRDEQVILLTFKVSV